MWAPESRLHYSVESISAWQLGNVHCSTTCYIIHAALLPVPLYRTQSIRSCYFCWSNHRVQQRTRTRGVNRLPFSSCWSRQSFTWFHTCTEKNRCGGPLTAVPCIFRQWSWLMPPCVPDMHKTQENRQSRWRSQVCTRIVALLLVYYQYRIPFETRIFGQALLKVSTDSALDMVMTNGTWYFGVADGLIYSGTWLRKFAQSRGCCTYASLWVNWIIWKWSQLNNLEVTCTRIIQPLTLSL